MITNLILEDRLLLDHRPKLPTRVRVHTRRRLIKEDHLVALHDRQCDAKLSEQHDQRVTGEMGKKSDALRLLPPERALLSLLASLVRSSLRMRRSA